MVTLRSAILVGCVTLAAYGAGAARADEPGAQPAPGRSSVDAAFGAAPLESVALADQRGGSESSMVSYGVVEGNSASGVTSGNNSISGDAFTGTNGLPMVIQNTGNNVLIQNSTVVDVQFK